MSKILANEIANYGDDSPIDLKEGLNIPAGKPVQAAGSSGTTGQVLSTTGTTVQWVTPFSGSYTDLSNRPTIPAAQVNSDWNASSGAAVILNKPVVPPQPSVTTASVGTAALTYNSGNGEFTFTPPDLSSFATETYVTSRGYLTSYTETDPIFSASAASNITTAKISNWDTSYSWGNHANQGYLKISMPHMMLRTHIATILHQADMMATHYERDVWKNGNKIEAKKIEQSVSKIKGAVGKQVEANNEVKEKFNTKTTDAKDIFNELFGEKK